MRALFLALVVPLAFGGQDAPKPDMIPATVQHNKKSYTQTYDDVVVSCPDGYEGHWVDVNAGFLWPWNGSMFLQVGHPKAYAGLLPKNLTGEIPPQPRLAAKEARPADTCLAQN